MDLGPGANAIRLLVAAIVLLATVGQGQVQESLQQIAFIADSDPWRAAKALSLTLERIIEPPLTSRLEKDPYLDSKGRLVVTPPTDYDEEAHRAKYAHWWTEPAHASQQHLYELLEECSDELAHPEATYMLYRMHLYGEWGIPHNWTLGWKYLERFNVLSNGTNATSLYDTAVAHATGLFGVIPVSPEKTLIYLQKASHLGSQEATQALAYRYLVGHHVPQDGTKALMLYSKVAHELRDSYPARFWHYHHEYYQNYGIPFVFSHGQELRLEHIYVSSWNRPLLRLRSFLLQLIEDADELGSLGYMDLGICDTVQQAIENTIDTYTQYADYATVLRRMLGIYEQFKGEIDDAEEVTKGCYGSGMALLGHLLLRGLGINEPDIEMAEQVLLHAHNILLSVNKSLPRIPLKDLGLLYHYEQKDYKRAAECYLHVQDPVNSYLLNLTQNSLSQEDLVKVAAGLEYGNLHSLFTSIQINELRLGTKPPDMLASKYSNFLERANYLQSPDLRNAFMQALMGNFENALWLYARSAELGSVAAMESAARILYKSPCLICSPPQIPPQRADMAFRYYDRARLMGSRWSAIKAGDICYRNGSYETAAALYLGGLSEYSRLTLAYMYEHGLGVDRNYHLAAQHYESATRFVPWAGTVGKVLVWKVALKSWLHSATWLQRLFHSLAALWNWVTI
ncbi:AaceriACL160Cp [[Ashbya] aceris (nom. inval.)]|nr:AaceriACL160Cp [[Ashbya] aceris (nom. inval.)]